MIFRPYFVLFVSTCLEAFFSWRFLPFRPTALASYSAFCSILLVLPSNMLSEWICDAPEAFIYSILGIVTKAFRSLRVMPMLRRTFRYK